MKRLLRVSFVMLTLVLGSKSFSQVDPHYSQYYVYPSWLNPALTGVFDGDYRVAAIYRNQWSGVAPFTTPGVAFDINTNKSISFGGSLLNQAAGNGGYNYLTAYGSASYSGIRFGKNESQRVIFGMQAGIMNRRFNRSKFTLGDQWNPITGYNPGTATTDVFTRTSSTVFDAGAGVLYVDGTPGKKANFYGGLSANHLTMPEDPFSNGGKEKLPMRFTVHGGLRLIVSDNFLITPNFLLLKQGKATEKMIGGYAQMRAGTNTDFLFGANWRVNDAIAPFVGFYHKNFVLGASYDVNMSDLGKMAGSAGSFEISLTYIGRKAFKAQEEHFVCPRL